MDAKLVGQALQYHGVDLLTSLRGEQQEQLSPSMLSYVDRRQTQDLEIK